MLFRKFSKNQRNIYFLDDKKQQKHSVSFKKHIVYSKIAAPTLGVCPLCNMVHSRTQSPSYAQLAMWVTERKKGSGYENEYGADNCEPVYSSLQPKLT